MSKEEILKNAKSMIMYANCAHMSRANCPIGHDKDNCNSANCDGTSGTFSGKAERKKRRQLAQDYFNKHNQEATNERQ